MCAAQYRAAEPGYRYEFPRDHFNHPEYQTEWWYYTGNLRMKDGRRFGYELTFFRQGVPGRQPASGSTWDVSDVYFAHLALSDLKGGEFYHTERFNRAGPGLAGASLEQRRIWNGNWQVQWSGDGQKLAAIAENFALQFRLRSQKPPVIHGFEGVSQKAAGTGHASHYVSFTRLLTSGTLELDGASYDVEGTSWMDHEFFTNSLGADEAGWDWLSLQLDDNTELMLYRLRHKDGSVDPFSSGTYVDREGKATHLKSGDFRMEPRGETWTSPGSGARYPVGWSVAIPSLGLSLEIRTPLVKQELTGRGKRSPSYWEGAIDVTGERMEQAIHGVGYLEMTGYDHPLPLEGETP
jgi:predicted secreted hydrolase